jgi:oligoendopeptidase F
MTTLPHWRTDTPFADINDPALTEAIQHLDTQIDQATALFDRHHVTKHDTPQVVAADVVESVLQALAGIYERARTINAYVYSFVSTNSRDSVAQARLSELRQRLVKLSQLGTRLTAWAGTLDVATLANQSGYIETHRFMLEESARRAEHQMSPEAEALSAELNVSGGGAWARLHSNITSQLSVQFDGKSQPMSAIRALAYDSDSETRRAAFEAELATWKETSMPLAMAINAIKGEVNTLATRRGFANPVDISLLDNRMDRATLDAMLGAAHDSFPIFRRYLQAKARLLGAGTQLPWYDLFAPVINSNQSWSYDDATKFVAEQFHAYSPRMGAFAERAFAEGWIDAEPRMGKVDGAFCMGLQGEESRVLMNYKPSIGSIMTLAHELGHAYHNLNLASQTPLNRDTPMTLAETASIFCETLTQAAALEQADEAGKLEILESSLQRSCQIVVDITSRYLFESRLFEQRRQRELSADELSGLMTQAQRETYGDGLQERTLHPYMWAVKGHYYSTGRSFYNYPYMFGQLFGMGLYAIYRNDAANFTARYDTLLSSTGKGDAATLARTMGIDITQRTFWEGSLAVVADEVAQFEAVVNAKLGA